MIKNLITRKASLLGWLFLFPIVSKSKVSYEDWTLTLVINYKGSLQEKIFNYDDRRSCYDEMFKKINEVKKSGAGAAGICMKLFVGHTDIVTEKDSLKILK